MQFTAIIEGRLMDDPDYRTTNSGLSVCRLRLGHFPSYRGADGQWKDGKPTYLTVIAWRDLADRVAKLRKGDLVLVDGTQLRVEKFGDSYTVAVTATNVAASMRFSEVTLTRTPRIPAPANGDIVVTAEREEFDADGYAAYATANGLTTAG